MVFQAFVSEYAVTGKDAGNGNLLAALAQAGLLVGLERNRYMQFSPRISVSILVIARMFIFLLIVQIMINSRGW